MFGVSGLSPRKLKTWKIWVRRAALAAGLAVLTGLVGLATAGCGSGGTGSESESGTTSSGGTLFIGGIPDQDFAFLEKRFNSLADYLEDETGISIRYIPTTSYAALVTAFENGDVQLGWFGALTGVQARNTVPGAAAIAQRNIDGEFDSVFIAHTSVLADGAAPTDLTDLRGLTFTFGSESSTSGHLMPRAALLEAGIDPEESFSDSPNYSGSHSKTLELVRNGSFQAGALSGAVWDQSLATDNMGTRLVTRIGPYFNYHWVAHPDLDADFGAGTRSRITAALLELIDKPEGAEILELFNDPQGGFIPTQNSNYAAIEAVAETLGLLGE